MLTGGNLRRFVIYVFRAVLALASGAGAAEVEVFCCDSITNAASGLGGGDTVLVHAGTYDEAVNITSGGSSWSSPLTIQAAPGETVKVRSLVLNRPYTIADGLNVDGQYVEQGAIGIGTSHLKFQNPQDRRGRVAPARARQPSCRRQGCPPGSRLRDRLHSAGASLTSADLVALSS